MTIRPGETLVYSTRWDDSEADHADLPYARRRTPFEIVINDERHEAMAKRQTLPNFLKGAVRSHAGASL